LNIALPVALALAVAACAAETLQSPTMSAATEAAGSTQALLASAEAARGADPDEAAELYRRAAAAAPDDPEPLLRLATLLTDSKDWAGAAAAYEAAISRGASDDGTRWGLGNALLAQGRAEAALPHLVAAHVSRSGDPRIAAALGEAQDRLGRHDEARATYEAGLKAAPQDLGLRMRLGLSRAAAGDLAAALDILNAVAAHDGATAEHRRSLALVLSLSGDQKRAMEVLQSDMDGPAAMRIVAQQAAIRALPQDARAAAILGHEAESGSAVARMPSAKGFSVHAAAPATEKAARDLAAKLTGNGVRYNVVRGTDAQQRIIYRVLSEPMPSYRAASQLARALQARGIKEAFVRPVPQS